MNMTKTEMATTADVRMLELNPASAAVADAKQAHSSHAAQPNSNEQETFFAEGVLDIAEDGFGFLRRERYLPGPLDVYVSASQIRRFGLQQADLVAGMARRPKDREQYPGLLRVERVNGNDAENAGRRPRFDALTPILLARAIRCSQIVPLR